MTVTEVFIQPWRSGSLLAYVNFVIDGLIMVRHARIIERAEDGRLTVVFPNRPAMIDCRCGEKHWWNNKFCPHCGKPVRDGAQRIPADQNGERKRYFDTVHPVGSEGRRIVTEAVLKAFHNGGFNARAQAQEEGVPGPGDGGGQGDRGPGDTVVKEVC